MFVKHIKKLKLTIGIGLSFITLMYLYEGFRQYGHGGIIKKRSKNLRNKNPQLTKYYFYNHGRKNDISLSYYYFLKSIEEKLEFYARIGIFFWGIGFLILLKEHNMEMKKMIEVAIPIKKDGLVTFFGKLFHLITFCGLMLSGFLFTYLGPEDKYIYYVLYSYFGTVVLALIVTIVRFSFFPQEEAQ